MEELERSSAPFGVFVLLQVGFLTASIKAVSSYGFCQLECSMFKM